MLCTAQLHYTKVTFVMATNRSYLLHSSSVHCGHSDHSRSNDRFYSCCI